MIATTERTATEACLVCMLDIVARARIRTLSSLRAVPALYSASVDALRDWLLGVGFGTGSCASIIRSHGVTAEDMTDEMLVRILNPQRRICRTKNRTQAEAVQASLHPAMDYVLSMAVESGSRAVLPYLMQMARNFAVDRFRDEREERSNTVLSDVETLRHGEADEQRTGAVKAHPAAAHEDDCELLRRETMAAAFSCFNNDFVHDVALLGSALRIPRQTLAETLYAGRAWPLACALVRRINAMLGGDYTQAFAPFLRTARDFRLPEKYRTDVQALVRCMYRATDAASRQAMKRRILAVTA